LLKETSETGRVDGNAYYPPPFSDTAFLIYPLTWIGYNRIACTILDTSYVFGNLGAQNQQHYA
jgi:hypothetical protein